MSGWVRKIVGQKFVTSPAGVNQFHWPDRHLSWYVSIQRYNLSVCHRYLLQSIYLNNCSKGKTVFQFCVKYSILLFFLKSPTIRFGFLSKNLKVID